MTPLHKNFSKNMMNTLSPRARELYNRYSPGTKEQGVSDPRTVRGDIQAGTKSKVGGKAGERVNTGSPELKKYFPGDLNGRVSSSHLAPSGNIQDAIRNDPERKRLYDTAVEFQSIFVNMMLKSMRKTLNRKEDILFGGFRQEVFEDMLYDKYSKMMSQNSGFSLADQMYRQLEPGIGVTPAAAKSRAGTDYENNTPGSPSSTLSTSRMYRR